MDKIKVDEISKEDKDINTPAGMKFDDDKLQWHLLPIKAVEEEIKVLMLGAEKYEENNWQVVPDGVIRYVNAAYRHLGEIINMLNEGKSLIEIASLKDKDTGLHPLASTSCDIHFALWLLGKIKAFDNNEWKVKKKEIRRKYKKEREKFNK